MSEPNPTIEITRAEAEEIVNRLNTMCVGLVAAENAFAIINLIRAADARTQEQKVTE